MPRLREGASAGLPRAYDIALEAIAHGDGRLDAESLRRFVAAYQTVAPLGLGELWAIPIMLRLALIENLRRVAARIASDRIDRNAADLWADRITATAERNPRNLILAVAGAATLAFGEWQDALFLGVLFSNSARKKGSFMPPSTQVAGRPNAGMTSNAWSRCCRSPWTSTACRPA